MAVEAAIIFPLLIVLVFGIIEFSLILRDYVSLNSLVRTGTRVAATLPRLDPATTVPTGQDLAAVVVDSMNQAGNALPRNTFEELWVYQANDQGFPLGTSGFTSCTTNCVIYRANTAGDFVRVTDTGAPFWDWESQNACPNSNIDSVGVWLRVRHDGITGLFFNDISISDFAVSNFEPIATFDATTPCGP